MQHAWEGELPNKKKDGVSRRTAARAGITPKKRLKTASRARKTGQGKGLEGTSNRLLDVAIDLFARHGYDAVSTTKIARTAGLTQSIVHYHFGTKEKLWKSAVARLMERRGLVFEAVPHEFKDIEPISRIKILLRRLFRANVTEPNYARVVMQEAMGNGNRMQWLLEQHLIRGYGVIDTLLKDAIENGSLRNLPFHGLSNILTSVAAGTVLLGHVTRAIYSVDLSAKENMDELEDMIISIIFDGLATPRQTQQVKRRSDSADAEPHEGPRNEDDAASP
jgi:TetR/AcrR family transcriptional regulator